MFEDIRGHKQQLELLEKALAKGVLAHAYVFAGPDGVGKKTIATKIAKELLEDKRENQDSFHPDFIEIDGREGIKIEQIRELSYKLSLKPYSAKNKIALIDAADQMSTEAANALLKTLEEPKSFTYIFLIATNATKLPKTILSRCQTITFGPMKDSAAVQDDFYETFARGLAVDRFIAAYEIADLETDEIKNTLDNWLKIMQSELQTSATKNLARKTAQVLLTRKFLDANANTKLLLTNLMISTQ